MRVKDRMTIDPYSIDIHQSIRDARDMMQEYRCRRLPVREDGKIVGIVTRSDISRAMPSDATSLSVHELNYLLVRTTIRDAMPAKQHLITIGPDDFIESAAQLMREHTIGGIPVMEGEKLVGIITETDIFDAFIDILGVRNQHTRIDFYIQERPGTLADIARLFGEKGLNIANAVVFFDAPQQQYKLILRVGSLDCSEVLDQLRASGYQPESITIIDHAAP